MQVRPSRNFVDGVFELRCKHCGTKMKVTHHPNAGWTIGTVIPKDVTDSHKGKCVRCKRYQMEVIKVPDGPEPEQVQGFDKVPVK